MLHPYLIDSPCLNVCSHTEGLCVLHIHTISVDRLISQGIGGVRTILKTQVPNARPLHLLASQEPEDIEAIGVSVESLSLQR